MLNRFIVKMSQAAAMFACAALLFAVHSAEAQEKTKTEKLLRAELDPFAADENGWTHMHWAAIADDGEAIRRLIDMGAFTDPLSDDDGEDFSEKGSKRAQLVGVKMSWNNDGETPLHIALYFGRGVAASVLIHNGADIGAKNAKGTSSLHFAANGNMADMAQLLMDRGADVNAKNDNGNTPLHRAAWKNALAVASLLLENDAEVNMKRDDGNTPLDRAIYHKLDEMQFLLRQHGGRCNKEC